MSVFKNRGFYLFLTMMMLSFSPYAQHIKECNGKTHWIFKQEHGVLAVDLNGKVEGENDKKMIKVNKFDLQCVIVGKTSYLKDGEDTDLKILTRYALQEINFQSEQLKSKLTLNAHKEEHDGKTFLLWYFEMPDNKKKEVKQQVYVNVIIGEKIFGLGSPRYNEMTLKEVKKFLIDTISSLKEFKKEKDVCKS